MWIILRFSINEFGLTLDKGQIVLENDSSNRLLLTCQNLLYAQKLILINVFPHSQLLCVSHEGNVFNIASVMSKVSNQWIDLGFDLIDGFESVA